jgi:hypothetical protein
MLTFARRVIIALLAVGAVAASFTALTMLALQTGWHPSIAWLLPLCIDALAAMALIEYARGAGRRALVVATGAIALSIAGNAAAHLFEAGMLVPDFATIAAVGGIPALSLGIAIHLLVPKGTEQWQASAARSSATSSPPPHTTTRTASDATKSTAQSGTRDTKRRTTSTRDTANADTRQRLRTERVRLVLANSWHESKSLGELASLLNASKSTAQSVRNEARSLATSGAQSNGDGV